MFIVGAVDSEPKFFFNIMNGYLYHFYLSHQDNYLENVFLQCSYRREDCRESLPTCIFHLSLDV